MRALCPPDTHSLWTGWSSRDWWLAPRSDRTPSGGAAQVDLAWIGDGYRDETQVTAQVISADPEYETDVLAFVGASAAVMLSDVPFPSPIAAVRVSH